MSQIIAVLNPDTVEGSELVTETFQFWFNDREHIRSPFPSYIHNDLKQEATRLFYAWASKLTDSAKEEMNDEMIGEKFEEIIFDAATRLVKTEDEKLTVLYPFLPRTGDKILDDHNITGIVISRSIVRNGDKSFLKVVMERADHSTWSTSFELPL